MIGVHFYFTSKPAVWALYACTFLFWYKVPRPYTRLPTCTVCIVYSLSLSTSPVRPHDGEGRVGQEQCVRHPQQDQAAGDVPQAQEGGRQGRQAGARSHARSHALTFSRTHTRCLSTRTHSHARAAAATTTTALHVLMLARAHTHTCRRAGCGRRRRRSWVRRRRCALNGRSTTLARWTLPRHFLDTS